ncbi:hypothetical protein M2F72_29900, partial [Klebsiella pneumoniae]|nr:hypothetical protein [Klebsiella pneumoniae]MDZ1592217.1 hypothetical protein [Klebsiella pneumoniae]MDZ3811011.1 hypothetical protein [Klebsiella pneumoniae]
MKTQPATGETYPKSDLFNKATNWPTYNKALINRGSITFWLDDEAIQAWYESATPSSR